MISTFLTLYIPFLAGLLIFLIYYGIYNLVLYFVHGKRKKR